MNRKYFRLEIKVRIPTLLYFFYNSTKIDLIGTPISDIIQTERGKKCVNHYFTSNNKRFYDDGCKHLIGIILVASRKNFTIQYSSIIVISYRIVLVLFPMQLSNYTPKKKETHSMALLSDLQLINFMLKVTKFLRE